MYAVIQAQPAFKLDNVTLMRISLGECLVLRAAAYEPRVHTVVADDICVEFFEVTLGGGVVADQDESGPRPAISASSSE